MTEEATRLFWVISEILDYEEMHERGCATNDDIPFPCDCGKWDSLRLLERAIAKAVAPVGYPASTMHIAAFATFLENNRDK